MADLSTKTLKQAQPGLLHLDNGGTPIDASATARRVDGGSGTDTALFLSTTSLGVGVTPTEELHIKGTGVTTLKLDSPASSDAELVFADNGTDVWKIFMDDNDDRKLKFIADDTGDAIIATFDKDGLFGIGTTAPTREFDVHFAGADTGVGIVCWSDTVDHSGTIVFEKSHNDTAGTDTATIDTEILGELLYNGNNGTIFKNGAKLQVIQNGAMGTLPPVDLVYQNSGSSGGALVEIWKVDKAGNMALGTRAAQATDLSSTFDIQKATGAIVVNWESDDAAVTLKLDAHTSTDASIELLEAGTKKWSVLNDGSATDTFVISGDGGLGSDDFLSISQTGNVSIGTATISTTGKLYVTGSASHGHELVHLNQADTELPFINFEGTSATSGTSATIILSDTTTDDAKQGAIQVEVNGTKRWIRIYDGPS